MGCADRHIGDSPRSRTTMQLARSLSLFGDTAQSPLTLESTVPRECQSRRDSFDRAYMTKALRTAADMLEARDHNRSHVVQRCESNQSIARTVNCRTVIEDKSHEDVSELHSVPMNSHFIVRPLRQ